MQSNRNSLWTLASCFPSWTAQPALSFQKHAAYQMHLLPTTYRIPPFFPLFYECRPESSSWSEPSSPMISLLQYFTMILLQHLASVHIYPLPVYTSHSNTLLYLFQKSEFLLISIRYFLFPLQIYSALFLTLLSAQRRGSIQVYLPCPLAFP